MNLADFIIGSIVLILLAFAIYKTYSNSKKGGCHSCGHSCSSKTTCHKE